MSIVKVTSTSLTQQLKSKPTDVSISSTKYPKKTPSTPVSKHFTTEGNSHQHMKFSEIQWHGNKTGPDCMRSHRKQELKYIQTIAHVGINHCA